MAEKTIKIFISQPMTGRKDDVVKKEREDIEEICRWKYGENIQILDTFIEGWTEKEEYTSKKPLWFLGHCMEALSEADVVVYTSGWESSKGCRLEREACKIYSIPLISLEDLREEYQLKK